MTQYAVILMHATSHAIGVEKLLLDEGIPCKMIPVPRHISSDCGACVRIRQQDRDIARQALGKANVEVKGILAIQEPEEGHALAP